MVLPYEDELNKDELVETEEEALLPASIKSLISAKTMATSPAPQPVAPNAAEAEQYIPQSSVPVSYPEGLADEDLKKAQEYRDFMSQIAMFGKAGSQIGAGIAGIGSGREITPGEGVWKELAGQGEAPAANIKERRAASDALAKREKEILDLNDVKAGQDPNSPESKFFRAVVKQKYPGLAIPDNLPMTKLKDMGLKVDSTDTKRYQQTVIEDNGQMKIAKFDTQTGAVELVNASGMGGPALKGYAPKVDPTTGEMSTANQALGRQTLNVPEDIAGKLDPQEYPINEKVRKEIAKRQTDINAVPGFKEASNLLLEADKIGTMSDQATTNPMAYSMLGTVVAKAFEGSRLTDDDVVRYTGRKDWAGKLNQAFQDAVSGTYSRESAELLQAAFKVLKLKEQAAVDTIYRQEAEQIAKNNGLPVDAVLYRLKPGAPAKAKDPKIEAWAEKYGKTYEQAYDIINNRKSNSAGKPKSGQ